MRHSKQVAAEMAACLKHARPLNHIASKLLSVSDGKRSLK
jgi:hypothetical protein